MAQGRSLGLTQCKCRGQPGPWRTWLVPLLPDTQWGWDITAAGFCLLAAPVTAHSSGHWQWAPPDLALLTEHPGLSTQHPLPEVLDREGGSGLQGDGPKTPAGRACSVRRMGWGWGSDWAGRGDQGQDCRAVARAEP